MTEDGYQVTAQDLVSHATDLRVFADNVRQAKGAAVDPMAYGVIGMAWGTAMNYWSDDARAFADKAADAAVHVADQLAAMAAAYDDEDQRAAADLRRAGGDAP